MTPVSGFIDLSAASGTLPNITTYATPIFSSTIQPAAFFEGILIGGILVAALMAAVSHAVTQAFANREPRVFKTKTDKWNEK